MPDPLEASYAALFGWLRAPSSPGRIEFTAFDRPLDHELHPRSDLADLYPDSYTTGLYAIADVAAFGIPHDDWGEEVKAVIALKPGQAATADEIIAYSREHLAAYKYPRVVDFIDTLPKNDRGKLDREALAASWRQQKSA